MNMLFSVESISLDSTIGFKINLIRLFGFTLMHNNHKGGHLSIGVSLMNCEISVTFSTWEWKLFKRRFLDG
mgnify:CR=1 FL=1|tara:strand:- start:13735 stop:13947 length:213 start_codon:yes stop_codon:yes gene_type:complete